MNLTSTAHSPSQSGTTSTVTISDAVTAGDLLVATVVTNDTSGIAPTVQVSSGDNPTSVQGATSQPGLVSVWLFYWTAGAPSAANSLTVSCTTHSGSSGLVVEHVAIPAGANISVLASTQALPGNNPSIGPMTWVEGVPTFAYGAFATGQFPGGTTTALNGFAATYNQETGGGNIPGLHTIYLANDISGSAAPALSDTGGTYWAAVGAVFGVETTSQLYLGGPAQGVTGVVSGPCFVRLGAPAPSTVTVALSSSDPSDTFTLTPGGSAITSVTIPSGSAYAAFRVNLSSNSGNHNITATATGYTSNGSPLAIDALEPTTGSLRVTGECQLENTSGTAVSILGHSADWGIQWRFRADTATGPSFIRVIEWGTTFNGTPLMAWNPTNQTATIAIHSGGGSPQIWTTTVPILLGLDYHFLVAGGATPTLYVCGVKHSTAPWSGATFAYGLLAIGASVGGPMGVAVDHRLSDVAIWGSYSPTATEASSLATGDLSPIRTASPADAWWSLGGTSGSSASLSGSGFADLAGGGNTFTVFGGSLSAIAYGANIAVGSPVQVNALVSKSGKLAIFGTCINQQAANGGYPLAPISAAPGTPTIRRNGTPISIGPAVGSFAAHDSAFVAYLLQCGGVQQVAAEDGGDGYTGAVTVTWNGDGGGTGLAIANPTTANGGIQYGATSCTVINGGSWTSPPQVSIGPPPNFDEAGGGSRPNYSATLSGTAIASLSPAANNLLGYGSGYTGSTRPTVSIGVGQWMQLSATVGTVNGVAGVITGLGPVPGGAGQGYPSRFQVNFWDPTGTGASAIINCGTGGPFYYVESLTGGSGYTNPAMTLVPIGNSTVVRANVNPYIAYAPVTNPGSGFTSPPTFSVSMAGGSPARAATLVPIMSGAAPGDAFTYNAPAAWLTPLTATQGGLPLGGIRAVSGASMTNSVGRREPAVGGFGCFAQTPTMLAGANLGEQPNSAAAGHFTAKNRYKQGDAWACSGGTLTTAPDGTPVSWTNPSGATISKFIYGPYDNTDYLDNMGVAGFAGQWTLRYDDPNVNTPSAITMGLSGGSTSTLVSTNVSGTTVTKVYDVELDANTNTWATNISLTASAPAQSDGLGHWTASNVWVVAPDAITKLANPIDATKPFAADDSFVRAVTAPGGKAIGCIRAMDVTQGYAGDSGFIWPWELLDPHADSWGGGSNIAATASYARFYNTDPNSTTYPWNSPKIYGGQTWFTQTDPPFTITGTLTAGSTQVTNLSSNALMVGSTVTGTGVPAADAYGNPVMIAVIPQPGTSFNLSAAATQSGTVTLTITNPNYVTIPPGNDGQYFAVDQNAYQAGVVEFRFAAPHGLSSGRGTGVFTDAAYGGHPSVGLRFTNTSGPLLPTVSNGGFVFVTGPYTVAVPLGIAGLVTATSGGYQTLASTAEIDLTAGGTVPGWLLFCTVPVNNACMPYEYPAAAAAQIGCGYWLNIPVAATDALVRAIAAKTIANIGDTVPVYLEFSNEIWNGSFAASGFPILLGSLWALQPTYPTGTKIATYYTANGQFPNDRSYGTAAPLAAHHYDTFTAAWTAAGLSPSRVKRICGSQWGNPGHTASICAIAAAGGFNFDGIAVGPYLDTTNDATLVRACAPPGTMAGAGYWPVDAINDFFRYTMAYGGNGNNPGFLNQATWHDHAAACQSSGLTPPPRMVCYEGGAETAAPYGVPFQVQLLHDCFADPSYRDVQWGWYAACQQGDQALASSGATVANDYQLYNAIAYATMWVMAYGPNQPAGDGLAYAVDANGQHAWPANQFATIQGGLPADNRDHNGGTPGNTSTALQGLRDWFEVSSPLPPQPTKPSRPRRWCPGMGQASYLRLARSR